MIVGGDQESGRTGCGIIDRLAELRVDHADDGADDVTRGPELAELTRLLDLPQDVLEEVALGVGVGLVEPQILDPAHDLGEDRRLVDHQSRAHEEVDPEAFRDLGVEREHLVTHPARQALAAARPRPARPAQEIRAAPPPRPWPAH